MQKILCVLILSICISIQADTFKPPKDQWLAIYIGDSQVGYVHERIVPDEGAEGEISGWGLSGNVEMKIPAFGLVMKIELVQFAFLNPDFSFERFQFKMNSSGATIDCRGEVVDNKLNLSLNSMGSPSTQTVDLNEPIYLPEAVSWRIAKEKSPPGTKFQIPIYDPLNTTMGNIQAEVLGTESIDVEGVKYDSYHVKAMYLGFEQESWIGMDGHVLRETSQVAGMPFKTEKTSEEKAKAYGANPMSQVFDFVDSSKIKTDLYFSDPRSVKELNIRVTGVSSGDMVVDSIQKLITPNKLTDPPYFDMQIKTPDIDPEKLPSKLGDTSQYRKYLNSSLLIQSDNPKIQKQAKEIVSKTSTPYESARGLSRWMYRNIDKQFRVTIPSAIEVLESRKGDCNEHSTLFAAMARGLGLPTKICTGVVYMEEAFWYHAWNEVLISTDPEVWWPVDSTQGLDFVDATHIKLAEGDLMDQGSSLGKVMGKMEINKPK